MFRKTQDYVSSSLNFFFQDFVVMVISMQLFMKWKSVLGI